MHAKTNFGVYILRDYTRTIDTHFHVIVLDLELDKTSRENIDFVWTELTSDFELFFFSVFGMNTAMMLTEFIAAWNRMASPQANFDLEEKDCAGQQIDVGLSSQSTVCSFRLTWWYAWTVSTSHTDVLTIVSPFESRDWYLKVHFWVHWKLNCLLLFTTDLCSFIACFTLCFTELF